MGRSLMYVCMTLVGLFSSFALGLFEEQAGEFDWKIENIGEIQQSINEDQKTFVATADSVLACLNINDGSLNWRAVLPKGTAVHHIIAGKTPAGSTDIFSLTSIKSDSDNTHNFLLSSWSSEQGTLRWQLSLGQRELSITDLVYDHSRYLITSLSGNSIDIATVRGYIHSHWNPSLSGDEVIISNAKNGKQLIISQLILQLKDVPKERADNAHYPSPSRIAVGCFTDSSVGNVLFSNPSSFLSENALQKCGQTAILSVALPMKLAAHSSAVNDQSPRISVKFFSPLPDVPVSSLRVAISSDDDLSYSSSDIIFGISANANKLPKIYVLNLSNNAVTILDVPGEISEKSLSASLLIVAEKRTLIPTVIYCTNPSSCKSFYISNSKNAKNTKTEMKVNSLSECTGVDSILSIEKYPSGGSIGVSISCGEKELINKIGGDENNENTCGNGSCSAESSLIITSSNFNINSEEVITVDTASIVAPLPRNIDSSALLFLSAEPNSKKGTRALVVFSSLLTVAYSSSPSTPTPSTSPSIGKESWRREESLSNIKQVVIVEDSRHHITSAHTAQGEEEDEAPSFAERLAMQFSDLKQLVVGIESSLASLPEMLYEHSITGFGMFSATTSTSIGVEVGHGIDSMAEYRRHVKKELFTADRVSKARLFGFNKIAVCFSSSLASIGGDMSVAKVKESVVSGSLAKTRKTGFAGAAIKLSGVDTLTGDVIWTLDPTLESAVKLSSNACTLNCDEVVFARMVVLHSSPSSSQVSLIVSTRSGTFSWSVDATTGHLIATMEVSAVTEMMGPLVGIMSMQKEAAEHKGTSHYLLVHSQDGQVSVSTYPAAVPSSESAAHVHALPGTYVHSLDKNEGLLSTYQISPSNEGIPISTAHFPGPLASVSYPKYDDVIDSRYSVLGDHSILMKYMNPHTALIAYFSDDNPLKSNETSSSGRMLHAALVDTVSSKILYRILLCKTASLPVHTLLVENHLIITYWNAKAKRSELSSSALYEGMVDVFGLSPLSYFSALPQQIRDANLSSFSSPIPLGIQRTYVIPRMVTSLHHTVTSRGMAHKNILMGLSGGQLFSLDHRMIHPRRPVGTPTTGEKEEGLVQYNPFIPIVPVNAVTLDTRVAGEAVHVVTASVRLESTSLVLIYGGLDAFFSRISPSQGFDVLASDFNYPLLIFLLLVLAAGVLALKNLHYSKTLKQSWA